MLITRACYTDGKCRLYQVWLGYLSGHLVGKSCSLFVICFVEILVISPFGSRTGFSAPGHFLLLLSLLFKNHFHLFVSSLHSYFGVYIKLKILAVNLDIQRNGVESYKSNGPWAVNFPNSRTNGRFFFIIYTPL